MSKKKIIFVTSTRADYGKLKSIILKLQKDKKMIVKVFVTGSHNMNLYAKTAKKYIIKSIHKGTNGDVLTGDYTPILFIRYGARMATAAGVSIPFARVGIFNMAKVPRTSKEI